MAMEEAGKTLIFSDIHANLEALVAVLGYAYCGHPCLPAGRLVTEMQQNRDKFDMVLCLGDIIGYGPNPNEVVELMAAVPNLVVIAGNHDEAVIQALECQTRHGKRGNPVDSQFLPVLNRYNRHARESLQWTMVALSCRNITRLRDLVQLNGRNRQFYRGSNFFACHSGPGKYHDKYLVIPPGGRKPRIVTPGKNPLFYSPWEALEEVYEDNLFVGHTHFVAMYKEGNKTVRNIGSVGLPRGNDVRAVYCVYDEHMQTTELFRVRYNTQQVIHKLNGLPLSLKTRSSILLSFLPKTG